MRMEVVEKTAPINGNGNNKRSSYHISDNLSLFYYKYIFKYLSQQKIMDSETFFKKDIETDFEEQYVPHQFEAICRQYLIRLNKSGKIDPSFEKIGKYYYDDPISHSNGEFDVVTEDEKGFVFYEAKFRKNPVTDSVIEEEIAQITKTGLNCYRYAFISRSGFKCKEKENICMISLSELFNLKQNL